MDTESLFVHDVMFTIPLGKLRIPVTNTIVMMWIIMVVMIVLALILVRPKKFEKVPKGKQLVAETIVGGIQNILVKNMGKKGKDFTPYFGTILLFLVFANIASIFNIIPSAELVHHWTGWMPKVWFQIEPPTSDLNLPLVLALMTICLIPMSSITDLVKYQLSTNTDWTIITDSVTGYGASRISYAMGSYVSVIVPDYDDVDQAKELIRKCLKGEKITQPKENSDIEVYQNNGGNDSGQAPQYEYNSGTSTVIEDPGSSVEESSQEIVTPIVDPGQSIDPGSEESSGESSEESSNISDPSQSDPNSSGSGESSSESSGQNSSGGENSSGSESSGGSESQDNSSEGGDGNTTDNTTDN